MPKWTIHHPDNVFTDLNERQALAQALTKMYTDVGLPPFYVAVIFIPHKSGAMYRGDLRLSQPDLEKPPYIYLSFTHVAKHFEPGESKEKTKFMEKVTEILKPFIADKGWDWEMDGEERDLSFLLIQGLKIPPYGSEVQKLWARENRPTPYKL
ncbi:hypothetical protein UCRNP2_402 [Neofusicoccum parvum UCRNP2]|uniref:Tautomerase cis-CaaD-like domain-containing protein n=1 Tax=Botryosphaeria parva (strain UCR-NP2) TaxID=1287680 RepID=R1EYS3_BOTPV|nr:hypothetical protein UCRNP2_402 [Neofusicoccum parvum UCRNP2]